ncbi:MULTISPECIES: DUF1120 domain-containing protein [Providencia]|uniref:DUF1120 domain-containing protein n=2 Tax=Gammaproteobacteria TaxID=1236 RepID=UPI00248108B4|nr:DUF1120 domain-containing protein [Providencia rettgeri]EMA4784620.1 DUF1120 domain-containing protein [Providencia rettgeri]EMB3084633.1 DUF1120 domain-containing protein [Providencia rettgeri]MDU7495974.1 DUF1120 domain-containing protein [Providencia rettgeri]HEM8308064.1 DUF1120 domain-containing protein [Providencia rettgeri]
MIKLIAGLLTFLSFSAFASDSHGTCNIRLGANEINYDTLADFNTKKQDGAVYAGTRIVPVVIECSEEIIPYLEFSKSSNTFSNNTSEAILNINNAMLDGKPILLDAIELNSSNRINSSQSDIKVHPNIRIQPAQDKKGKVFSFNLVVDLKINSLSKKGVIVRSQIPLQTLGGTTSLAISYSEMTTACNLIVDSTSIDYGVINRYELNDYSYTILPEKNINFTVQCDSGKTAIAIQVSNQMKPSLAPNKQEGINGYGLPPVQLLSHSMMAGGLGNTQEGIPIGGYAVALDLNSLYIDNNKAEKVQPISGNSSCGDPYVVWQHTNGDLLPNNSSNKITSWAKLGSLQPVLFSNIKGIIKVQAFINKAYLLNVNKGIKFKGRSIIELCYL